jgi:hypothetical protein
MFQYVAISIPAGRVAGVRDDAARPPVVVDAAATTVRGGGGGGGVAVEEDSSDDGSEAEDHYSIDSELSADEDVTETQVDLWNLPVRFDPNLSDEEEVCETQF